MTQIIGRTNFYNTFVVVDAAIYMLSFFEENWYAIEKLTNYEFVQGILHVKESQYIGTVKNTQHFMSTAEMQFQTAVKCVENNDDIWIGSKYKSIKSTSYNVHKGRRITAITQADFCQYCECDACKLGISPYNKILSCKDGTRICEICYEYPECYESGVNCEQYSLTGQCIHRPEII